MIKKLSNSVSEKQIIKLLQSIKLRNNRWKAVVVVDEFQN